MLDVVRDYLGDDYTLWDIDNWFTVPSRDAESRVASQRWHRDEPDTRILKMFTYFVDVDEETGPLEYLRGSAEGGKYWTLYPQDAGFGYPPQDLFESAIDPASTVTMTGPAGTVIFCDTAGFHRGGFARSRPRVLSYMTYMPPGHVPRIVVQS